MAKVVFDHVYKKFPNGVVAVNDANLEVRDKEFIVLSDRPVAGNHLLADGCGPGGDNFR